MATAATSLAGAGGVFGEPAEEAVVRASALRLGALLVRLEAALAFRCPRMLYLAGRETALATWKWLSVSA